MREVFPEVRVETYFARRLAATSGHRRVLRTVWPWVAAAIALLGSVPYVVWQWQNDWPTLEFMQNAAGSKMVRTGFVVFWSQQVLVMNPASVPVWLVGLVALLASRRTRVLGIVFVAVAALLVVSGSSRPNYLAVAYAPLFAAGAAAVERAVSSRRRAWMRPVTLAGITMVGAPVVPMELPLLPVDRLIAYNAALGLRPRTQERTREGDLPQVLADMFGWEDMVRRGFQQRGPRGHDEV
jgi:hypothetical protein